MCLDQSCTSQSDTILTIPFVFYLVHFHCLFLVGIQVCSSPFTCRIPCEHRIKAGNEKVEYSSTPKSFIKRHFTLSKELSYFQC